MEYAIYSLSARIGGHLSPPTELARFEVEIEGKAHVYPVLISTTVHGTSLEKASAIETKQLTWACLCALLTRPGDGRFSNYLIEEKTNHTYCVDNDISFIEPATQSFMARTVHFSSALFCLDEPLDSSILDEFTRLDSSSILQGWIDDLIRKDYFYRNLKLFSIKEEKSLYDEDKMDRYKGTLLLKSGTLTTLFVQFTHLQNCLREVLKLNKTLYPYQLLQYLVTVEENQMQPLNNWVYKTYKEAFARYSSPKKRLQQALNRNIEVSLKSSQTDEAGFGRLPSFEEIQMREEFSPEKAQQELFAFTLNQCEPGVVLGKHHDENWVEADFKRIIKQRAPDKERQRNVLNALTFLMLSKDLKPQRVTLTNCSVLDSKALKPFLHLGLIYLNLSGCTLINELAIQEIEKRCPHLKKLYLNRCSKLGVFAKTKFLRTIDYLKFAELEELRLIHCPSLSAIYLDTPRLLTLKADRNRLLDTLVFKDKEMFTKIRKSFTGCPQLNLTKMGRELVLAYLKEGENQGIDPELLLQVHANEPTLTALDSFHSPFISINDPAPGRWSSDRGVGIYTNGLTIFSHALAYNTHLKELAIRSKTIGKKGIGALAHALTLNQTLTKFNFSQNEVEGGMDTLALAVASNKSLTQLVLRGNKIGKMEIQAFSKAISSNKTLTQVDLSENYIRNEGIKSSHPCTGN